MRTHPDIGLMTTRPQAYSRLAATCACVVFSPTGTVDRGKVVGSPVNDPFIVIVLNRSRSVCLHGYGSCIRLAMLKYFRVCGYQVNGDKGGVKLLCSRQPGCNSHVSLATLVMVK